MLGIYINNAGQMTLTNEQIVLPVRNEMQIDGETVTTTDKAIKYRLSAGVLEIETDLIFEGGF